MKISEFIKKTNAPGKFSIRPRVVCNDGFAVSIQASSDHYCSPRVDNDDYHEFELGFPSEEDDLIIEYAESHHNYTDTVYGWVPEEVVNELIKKHGGINIEETFKNAKVVKTK